MIARVRLYTSANSRPTYSAKALPYKHNIESMYMYICQKHSSDLNKYAKEDMQLRWKHDSCSYHACSPFVTSIYYVCNYQAIQTNVQVYETVYMHLSKKLQEILPGKHTAIKKITENHQLFTK